MDLLEKIKLKHEQLEAERKVFEDLEFRTMEEEAQMEAEIEEVSMVMNNTQKELDTAETVVSEMELQKAEISINQDVSILQVLTTSQYLIIILILILLKERKETVASKLEAEKQKLGELEVFFHIFLVLSFFVCCNFIKSFQGKITGPACNYCQQKEQ